MTKKELNGLLHRTFRNKSISPKKRYDVMSGLEEFRESDPVYFYSNAGKLCTLFGPVDAAIDYLETASGLSQNNASIYYNLYKCYVRKGDFNQAFMNLYECSEKDTLDGDFSLAIAMLSSLAHMDIDFQEYRVTDYIVEDSGRLGLNTMTDPKLKTMYEELIKLFNERKYGGVVKNLGQMKGHIENIGFPMEVDTLLIISRALVKKENEKYREMLNGEIDLSMSCDDYLLYVKDLITDGFMPVKRLLKEIEKLAKTDIEKALRLLDMVSQMDIVQDKAVELSYLRNLINEKISFDRLDDDVKDKFNALMTRGRELYHTNRNKEAAEVFKEAYTMSGVSVCEYYIGKCLYKMGKLCLAREYLETYAEHGGEKLDKCLLYLTGIAGILKQDPKVYSSRMVAIHETFDRDYHYNPRKYDKKNKQKDDFDGHKHRMSKKLIFSVEDFENNSCDVENYYDCDTDGKLRIIRNLFRSGKVDVANKLLEELNRTCSREEKGKVLQMIRNKKLYANQRI